MTFSPITISDNLFAKLPRYFPTFDCVAIELLQNAYRATLGLPNAKIDLTIKHHGDAVYSVTCADNGRGIADFGRMLSLATSDWPTGVQETMDPAGMGVCALLAAAPVVHWSTRCEADVAAKRTRVLLVDSGKYFNDAEYRAGLDEIHAMDVDPSATGTEVQLLSIRGTTYEAIRQALLGAARWLSGPVITINGEPVTTGLIELNNRSTRIPFGDGCIHVLKSTDRSILKDRNSYHNGSAVLWHGCLVRTNDSCELEEWSASSPDLPDEVRRHLPADGPVYTGSLTDLAYVVVADPQTLSITPKLPDRSEVVQDAQTKAYLKKVRRAIMAHQMAKLVERLQTLRETYDEGTDEGVHIGDQPGIPPGLVRYLAATIYRVEAFMEPTLEPTEHHDGYEHPTLHYDPADCDYHLSTEVCFVSDTDSMTQSINDDGVGLVGSGWAPCKIIVMSKRGTVTPVVLLDGNVKLGKHAALFHKMPGVDVAMVPNEEVDDALLMELSELREKYPVEHLDAVGVWGGQFSDSVSTSMVLAGEQKASRVISEAFQTNATSDASREADSHNGDDMSRGEYEKMREREFARFWSIYGGKLDLSEIYDAISNVLGVSLLDKHLIVDQGHIRLVNNGSTDTEQSWQR